MPNQIKAAQIAKKPQPSIKKLGNKRFCEDLEEFVLTCATFDFDDQVDQFYELTEELRRRLKVPSAKNE